MDNAPFADSQWMWIGDNRFDLPNVHAQARRTFDLAVVPKNAGIRITADARYRLWVNGEPVCRGPARGYQDQWPFDRVDLAPFLRVGRNVIAVQVHSLGVGTFGYVHAGASALIVAGTVGAVDLASGGGWRMRRAPELRRTPYRVSLQLGFQEHVVGDRVEDWAAPDYDDAAWPKPHCQVAGGMPWHAFSERGVPLMREDWATPKQRTHAALGTSPAIPTDDENPTVAYLRDAPAWTAATADLIQRDGWAEVAIPAGSLSAVSLDFTTEEVGSFSVEVDGGETGTVLDLLVTEESNAKGPVFHPPHTCCEAAFAARIHLRAGTTRFTQFDHWGFRHVVLVARHATRPLTVRLRLRTCLYPLDAVAPLRTADAVVDRIWDMCVRTQQCCSLDAYVDCPWREQAQWWGDARVQAANTFVMSADHRLLERGIRSIAGMEVPNGLTYGHAPTIAHSCILPDFTLTWISTFHDHWRQTGDLSLFREQLPRLRRALEYFRGKLQKKGPAKGLLPYDERYWLFLDWCPIFKGGYPTLYNLYYIQALGHAAELCARIGEKAEAARLRREEKAAIIAVRRLQVDGVFAGGRDWSGKLVAQDSAHCDALAYLLGIVPQRNQVLIDRLKTLVARDVHEPDRMRPSAFFMHYVLTALDQAGERAAALGCIRRWWGTMVERGLATCEENWFNPAGQGSLCHAWSAHPIVHLSRILLGVRQDGVAWKTVTIEPLFALDRAEGAVATPHGAIRMAWKRSAGRVSGQVTVPKGVKAVLRLPGAKPTVISGRRQFACVAP